MQRSHLLTLALGFGLLTGGCDQENGTSKPPATGNVTQTEQQPATQESTLTITSDAAGVVQLGMTLNEVLTVLADATSKTTQDGDGVEWTDINIKDEAVMSVMLNDEHTISLIRVFSPRFSTEQGVRVGENIQSAADKLGGLSEIQSTEIESREFATFKNSSPNVQFQVIGKDGSAGVYANAETTTSIAAPSATIQSIWILED
jgi:hypothetical protein